MSAFLNDKYLKYRGLFGQPAVVIDVDRFCEGCGYNLRGRVSGRVCPECGLPSPPSPRQDAAGPHGTIAGAGDALLGGDFAGRRRMLAGLTLLPLALVVYVAMRLGIVGMAVFAGAAPYLSYLWCGLGLTVAWALGTWLVTPPRLNAMGGAGGGGLWMVGGLRLAARWVQLLWVVGAALQLLHFTIWRGTALEGPAVALSMLAQAIALAGGTMPLIVLFIMLAERAGLDDAARRLNLALWMLPLPTLLLAVMPDRMFWVAMLLVGPVLLVWAWFMITLVRGIIPLRQHVSWALRIAAEHGQRAQRMVETRGQLDREVLRQVRVVAPPERHEAVPIEPMRGNEQSAAGKRRGQ